MLPPIIKSRSKKFSFSFSDNFWKQTIMTISKDPAHSNPFPFTPYPPPPPPRTIRVNENQASRADSHEEVEESTNKHIQGSEVAAIWKTLVTIEPNANFLFNEKKTFPRNYRELRESLEFTQSKIEEIISSNSALQEKIY